MRLAALGAEIEGHRGNVEELERQIAEARERMQEKNQEREQLQAAAARAREGHRERPARRSCGCWAKPPR